MDTCIELTVTMIHPKALCLKLSSRENNAPITNQHLGIYRHMVAGRVVALLSAGR